MIEKARVFLLRVGRRFGTAAWLFYALVFLLFMSLLLALIYLVFGVLIYISPHTVLLLSGVLVALIFYRQFRSKLR